MVDVIDFLKSHYS